MPTPKPASLRHHATRQVLIQVAAVLVALMLAACGERAAAPPAAPGHRVVTVHYGTSRLPATDASGYGIQAGPLRYGSCGVSIPRDHRMGELESPAWPLRADPDRHVLLLHHDRCDAATFAERLAADARRSGTALVFIHGFNVSFTDAARRTAQVAYDLGFEGAPCFFSWPSSAELTAYRDDERAIAAAQPAIDAFLDRVIDDPAIERVHILAHSMGNRAVTSYLLRAGAQRGAAIRSVLLTAPDIDAAVFRSQIAPALAAQGLPVTLYVSTRDRALTASAEFNGGPRAGDASGGVIVHPPITTVDASAVDTSFVGHSYYGDERSVIADMFYLVRHGLPPAERHGLRPQETAGGRYWVMAP